MYKMFIEERLLDSVSFGTVYGESFKTDVVTMRNKSESRNMLWSESQGLFTLVFNAMLPEDRFKIMQVFRTCRGRGIGFRLKNWTDFKAERQKIGITTGSNENVSFQLKATYESHGFTTEKTIYKPVEGGVKVFSGDEEIPFTLDYTTGIVTIFDTKISEIYWSGEFDIPVRFDSDEIHWSVDSKTGDNFIMGTDLDLREITFG